LLVKKGGVSKIAETQVWLRKPKFILLPTANRSRIDPMRKARQPAATPPSMPQNQMVEQILERQAVFGF
jgi:hypothetical protein